MRITLASRYEQTLLTFFRCLCVGLFGLLILLLLNAVPTISSVVISVIVVVSLVFVVRAFHSERKYEIFDISSATLFETGLLVFQSPRNRCAIFFAFKIDTFSFEKVLVQRALTILLKVLPVSTVFALEWTSQRECFITFYIKLEKSSFLTRARELLDNISKSLKTTLGAQCVRLLSGDDLTNHFSMAIPGRFQRISASGRYGIKIQTDIINTKKVFAKLTPTSFDNFTAILSTLEATQNSRMILSIKKIESATRIPKSLTVIFGDPVKKNPVQIHQLESTSLSQIPASKSIQLFGEVLSRNQIYEPGMELDFPATAKMIINLLSTPWSSRTESEISSGIDQEPFSDTFDSQTWRELLAEQLSDLEPFYQKDKIIFIDRLPIRVDAQVDDLLVYVVPQAKEYQIRWFVRKMSSFLEKDETKSVIFLLTQAQKTVLARDGLSNFNKSRQIRFVETKQELTVLLRQKKTQLLEKQKRLAQVA